jgi:hypothetical protein
MRLWVSAGIIACVILVLFALSVPHTRDVAVKRKAETEPSSVPAVSLRDTYKKGVHTLSGAVTVPNACTPVAATASAIGEASSTTGIQLEVTYQIEPGVCLQVPTEVSFQATLAAPANIPIQLTVNGSPASTTPS